MAKFVCLETYRYNGEPTEIVAYNPEYIVKAKPNGKDWTDIWVANGDAYNERNNVVVQVKGAFKDVIELLEGNAQ